MATVAVHACILLLASVPGATPADGRPSIDKLLGQYETTVSQLSRFELEGVDVTENTLPSGAIGKGVYGLTVRRDGPRWKIRYSLDATREKNGEVDPSNVTSEYVVGEEIVNVTKDKRWPEGRVAVSAHLDGEFVRGRTGGERATQQMHAVAFVFGLLWFDDGLPVWQVLKECESLTLSTDIEEINGISTWVVRGSGKRGDYAVWLDPENGCLPRRLEIERRASQLPKQEADYGTILKQIQVISDIEITRYAGVPVISGYTSSGTVVRENNPKLERKVTYHTTSLDLDPRFAPDAFALTIPIPDGTRVTVKEARPIRYEWRGGRVQKRVEANCAE